MTKMFQCGEYTFKGYFKKAGTGYEIGYKFNNKNYFVSNFIDHDEAKKWWSLSQKYVTTFCKNEFYPQMNVAFFGNFMGNYMYNHYYTYVKSVATKNYAWSHKNYKKDFARYTKYKNTYAA